MPRPRLKQLTWNKTGVERLEYFMAEEIAYYVVEKMRDDWSDYEDNLIERLRCVQGERIDGKKSPDYLSHSIAVAGNIMGNMMAQKLMNLLLSPDDIAGLVGNAIERAIMDEEYDRLHKEPEDYEIP